MLVNGLAGRRVRRLFVIGALGPAGAARTVHAGAGGAYGGFSGMIEGPQTPGDTTNQVAVTGEPALMNNDSVADGEGGAGDAK